MLTFKTQFPVHETATVPALLDATRQWLAGSPHSALAARMQQARELFSDGATFSEGSESLTVASLDHDGSPYWGARWDNNDDEGRLWVTEVTGCRRDDAFWISVSLNVDAELPVERLEQGRPPHVIKTVMRTIGGGMDGALRVSDRPHFLEEGDVDAAARLIAGDAGCRMPVVFVSTTMTHRHHVDSKALAEHLSGMAHVVVEPSRQFSVRLMRATYGENAYGGAVAIYWPDGIGKWVFLPHHDDEQDAHVMQKSIVRKVRQSLLSQRTLSDCTWSHLQDLRARKRFQELRDSGSREFDDFATAFDDELAAHRARITELEEEVRRLRARRIDVPRGPTASPDRSVTLRSGMDDLYQGERDGLMVELLRQAFEQTEVGTRRHAVLKDLLERNQIQSEKTEVMERVKTMLRGYTSMNASLRSDLEDLGFEVREDGRHIKLVFRGEDRFPIVIAKTSSDHRAGMNATSEIRRVLF